MTVSEKKAPRAAENAVSDWSLSSPAPTPEISARDVFQKVFRQVRPRTPIPDVEVRFRQYTDVYNVIRVREGKLIVGLSDLLAAAPRTVLESIAFILIAKLYRKPVPDSHQNRYRRFLNRRSTRHQAQQIRQFRGRKQILSAQGACHNLETIFDELNQRFFSGLLSRPRLTWSRMAARTALGHYDHAHNTIVISSIFDRKDTPRFLLEYILYHEMLHVKHPVIHKSTRRCFHSAEFRAEEKKFPDYLRAKRLLQSL